MPESCVRRGIMLVALACASSATTAPAGATSLNGARATLQFNGTMSTTWTIPPQVVGGDQCFTETEHGSGKQLVEYRMPGHANVNIVDFGGSIDFQVPVANRAGPRKRGTGFPFAQLNLAATTEYEWSFAKNISGIGQPGHSGFGPIEVGGSSECGPMPAPSLLDESGCGGHKIPWDAQALVLGGRLYPSTATFTPSEVKAHCPFHGVIGKTNAEQTEMPNGTFHGVSAAEVRRALRPRHGTLIIHGTQTWKSDKEGPLEVKATTTVTWKLVLIRAG